MVLAFLCGPRGWAATLAADGKTRYVIALADGAIPAEQTAARELQEHLSLVTGAEFPIRAEGEGAPSPRIVVGPGALFRQAFPHVDLAALKHDGIVMKTVGDDIYLAGGRPRGTLYAVYTFLEDVVGCRWWSATEAFAPRKPTLETPALDKTYVPKLQYREAFYRGAFDGVFAARLKCNGHFERVPPEYGGHYRVLGWCHTFYQLLPPETHFQPHPDWYSEINGKRTADGAQLCLANDEMRAEFTRVALEWLRKDPDAGMISISQNDWGGRCQCERCRAAEEAEGSPSGPLIQFVNAVAAEIEKEFPDVLVETLAYQYTRRPPADVRPRRNVIIRLCSIECSFSQPLGTGEQNESFRSDIEAWSQVAPQLYVWDYVTNFANYILPHPNLRVLAPNIRLFVDHKCIGLFEQGDSGCSCSDFPELRAWLLAHLMWDPSLDEGALAREFLEGYYGAAAPALQAYLDLIHDAVQRTGTYLRCFMPDTSSWLGLDDVSRATQLFNEAEKAVADDAVLTARVRRARMPLDHVWLNRWQALRRHALVRHEAFLGPQDPQQAVEQFIQRAHDFDAGAYREGRPFSEYEEMLRSRFRPARPPDICRDLPEDEWIDVQDSQFTLHGRGNWVELVDDAKASDGRAARMPGGHTQWAAQYPVPADLTEGNPWHCYVVARCDAKAEQGAAFTVGLYDSEAKRNVAQQAETLEQARDGEYRTYVLGAHDLTSTMYFWIAPPGNAGAVNGIYVDRIFLVRQKQGER
jgi:hypothetical protein